MWKRGIKKAELPAWGLLLRDPNTAKTATIHNPWPCLKTKQDHWTHPGCVVCEGRARLLEPKIQLLLICFLCSQEKVRAGCWRISPVSLLSHSKQSYLDSASDPLRKELKSSQWCWHLLGTVTHSFPWLGCSFIWLRGTWWWPCLAGWVTWFVPAVEGPQTLSPPCWASSGFQTSRMSKSNHVSPHAQGSGCRLCQPLSPRVNPSWSTTCLLLPQCTCCLDLTSTNI